jgi:trimeric autotransporter adhesin
MSTKTTFKRIALVAVAALGFGTLSVAPSSAAAGYLASFTAPSTVSVLTGSADTATARDIGTIQVTLTGNDTFTVGTDTVTVTIAAQTASGGVDAAANTAQQNKNNAFLAKLSISSQATEVAGAVTTVAATASNDTNFATTGWNATNNAIVSTTNTTMLTSPRSGSFTSAVGRAYIKMAALAATEAAALNGGVVTYNLTITSGAGLVQTFTQTLTATAGTRIAGTNTVPTTTGTIAAGGSATLTFTAPYTSVLANEAWTDRTFTLGGTATGSTFSVTGVATGGSVTLVRTSATTIEGRAVKNALTGAFSTTYTIVVNAPSTATAGQPITVAGFTVTVQPYTPTYSYSEASIAVASNGYLAVTGDGILWADARVANGKAADVTIVQKDQNGATITQPAFAKTVTATITGRGSLDAASGADVVVKSKTWSVINNQLTSGTTAITVFPDGVSGEGTLAISVDGVAVKSYTMRFFGDAATVEATLVRSVGSTLGATNGADGGATSETNNLAAGTTKSVTATTTPAIAVVVKDANGYAIPTASGPIATSSNLAVVSSATRMFVDSGISDAATLKASAGTFVQHYSYTTVANSASGSSSSLTFNFVNRAGTSLASTPVVVKVGGEIAKTVVTLSKPTFAPGEAAKITFTSTDAAGNAAFDGQNAAAGGLLSTLGFTGSPTSALIVGGSKVVDVYAPASPGAWTITDVTGKAFTATATVTNLAAEAKAAGEAATEAATAAADAAAEATDAANAATDAANAAAEAADAATAAAQDSADAVAALSTQVTELVSALRKQITSLTNLVIKIQRKVRA